MPVTRQGRSHRFFFQLRFAGEKFPEQLRQPGQRDGVGAIQFGVKPVAEFQKVLESIYKNGKIILTKNINLKVKINKNALNDHEIFQNMIKCLNEYKDEYFDKVDYIVVEKQMKINQKACRLSICCITYFMINSNARIFEFDSFHKTQILGAEKEKVLKNGKITYKSIDKPKRKKWSIETGIYILNLRDEFDTMVEIFDLKKKDDIYDNINMCQAFKYLYFIDKVIF